MKYSAFGRALLAIYLSIRHFHNFLEGYEFCFNRSQAFDTCIISCDLSLFSKGISRHLDFISQYAPDIRHINGKESPVTDTLSCMDINALHCSSAIDFTILAAAQQNDPEIPALKTSSSLCIQDVPLRFSTDAIVCDMSTALPRS